MNKRRLLTLAALLSAAALLLLLPGAIGLLIEKRYKEALAEPVDLGNGVALRMTAYERDWFTARAAFEVDLTDRQGLLRPVLEIKQRLSHGPVLNVYPFAGIAATRERVRIAQETDLQEGVWLGKAFEDGLLLEGSSGLSLLGTLSGSYAMPKTGRSDAGSVWEPLSISYAYSFLASRIKAEARWPLFRSGEFSIEDAHADIEGTIEEGAIYEGRSSLGIRELRIGSVYAQMLKADVDARQLKGSIETRFELGAGQLRLPDAKIYSKPAISAVITGQNKERLKKMVQELRRIQETYGHDAEMSATLTSGALLSHFIDMGDEGAVLNLAAGYDHGGKFVDFKASLGTLKEAAYLPDNPATLAMKLRVEANLTAPGEELFALYPAASPQIRRMIELGYFEPGQEGRLFLSVRGEGVNWQIGGKPLALFMMQMR